METINFEDLPEQAQDKIDEYPEEQSFSFYWNGSEIRAVPGNLEGLVEAQGGMDEEWQLVVW